MCIPFVLLVDFRDDTVYTHPLRKYGGRILTVIAQINTHRKTTALTSVTNLVTCEDQSLAFNICCAEHVASLFHRSDTIDLK
jgi:hypothetical protein